jgi:hypothetical protein
MKNISITLVVCVAALVIILNNNCVHAADEDTFEEGKYIYISYFDMRERFQCCFAFAHFFLNF